MSCSTRGRKRGIKDHKTIAFRTLFGKLDLVSPLSDLLLEHRLAWVLSLENA